MVDPETLEARRSEQRFRCAIAVMLRRRGVDEQLLTSDVSFRGAHVRTDTPPPKNSLVRLVFTLPPDDAKITLSAHVIRVTLRDGVEDQYPGFVARFVGLDGAVKDRWEKLISWVRAEHGQSVRKTVTFARPSYVRLFQSKAPAMDDAWLRPGSVEELRAVILEQVPNGAVVVPGAAKLAPGVNVMVRLVHPITLAVFAFPGVVRRRGDDAPVEEGLLVGLPALTAEIRAGLTEMADSVIVLEDYDVELYEDPLLET